MKGIELLPFLTEKQKELLKTSDMQYKRYARIFISIVGFDNNTVTVKVAQKEMMHKNIYRQKNYVIE